MKINEVVKCTPSVGNIVARLFVGVLAMTLAACGSADTVNDKIPDEVLKWPYKDAEHFITVRIPGGYRFLDGAAMGAILGPHYPDPDKTRGFSTELYIETLWPDMSPRTPLNQPEFVPPKGGIGRSLSIQAYATLSGALSAEDHKKIKEDGMLYKFDGSDFTTKQEWMLEKNFHIQLLFVGVGSFGPGDPHGPYYFPVEAQPGKFGLDRIGVDYVRHPKLLEMDRYENDGYYLRDKQGRLQTFIMCTNETVPEPEDDPTSSYWPNCTQQFYFDPLTGIVKIRYQRKFLKDWREIQAKTEQLLQSFIQLH